jgi:hypothetical protein
MPQGRSQIQLQKSSTRKIYYNVMKARIAEMPFASYYTKALPRVKLIVNTEEASINKLAKVNNAWLLMGVWHN